MISIGLAAAPVRAHELSPIIADIELATDGTASLNLSANLEALIAGIGPEHDTTETAPQADRYDALRQLSPEGLNAAFDDFETSLLTGLSLRANDQQLDLARIGTVIPDTGDIGVIRQSDLTYSTRLPQAATTLGWQMAPEFGPVVLRLRRAGDDTPFYAELLTNGVAEQITLDATAPRTTFASALTRYIKLGFDHILPKGLDHVLFIIGLFLLSAKLRPLLVQVTTFTLAHSVTLALGLLGWINIPGSIVEPLIALSIVFIAVENIFTQNLHRWRTAIVFGFGLLHGLGFAGVLRELTVSSGQFAASLIGFNVGVELGQITVVVLCYVAVGYWFGARAWYHTRIVMPASVIIALIAGYWFCERVGLIA